MPKSINENRINDDRGKVRGGKTTGEREIEEIA